MDKFLITGAVLGATALLVVGVRRHLKRRAEQQKQVHIVLLRETLGIKPDPETVDGAGGADKISTQPSSSSPSSPTKGRDKKPPTTALMLHPDADGLRVNGPWLETILHTIEPEPNFGTRATVREAHSRARALYDQCGALRRQHKYQEAEERIREALNVVSAGIKRDHWFTAEVLNQLACVRYEQAFYSDAREIWQQAEQVCQEWPSQCQSTLVQIQDNLKLVRGMLGF